MFVQKISNVIMLCYPKRFLKHVMHFLVNLVSETFYKSMPSIQNFMNRSDIKKKQPSNCEL